MICKSYYRILDSNTRDAIKMNNPGNFFRIPFREREINSDTRKKHTTFIAQYMVNLLKREKEQRRARAAVYTDNTEYNHVNNNTEKDNTTEFNQHKQDNASPSVAALSNRRDQQKSVLSISFIFSTNEKEDESD